MNNKGLLGADGWLCKMRRRSWDLRGHILLLQQWRSGSMPIYSCHWWNVLFGLHEWLRIVWCRGCVNSLGLWIVSWDKWQPGSMLIYSFFPLCFFFKCGQHQCQFIVVIGGLGKKDEGPNHYPTHRLVGRYLYQWRPVSKPIHSCHLVTFMMVMITSHL